jgi:hypothetical protein
MRGRIVTEGETYHITDNSGRLLDCAQHGLLLFSVVWPRRSMLRSHDLQVLLEPQKNEHLWGIITRAYYT